MIKKYSDVVIGICIGYYMHKVLRATDSIVTTTFDKAISFFTDIFINEPEMLLPLFSGIFLLILFLLPEKQQRKLNSLTSKLGFKLYILPSDNILRIAYNQGLTWKEY